MMPGTHMLICSPPPAPPVQEYSQPRCGWPCHQRAQAGRSSPVRCPHSASAPAGSACGGARMTTCRAPSASTWWRRRRSHARPAITAAAAAASTGPAAGPHAARACSSSRASRAAVPPGSVTYRPSGPPGPPAAISSRCPVTAACPHQRRRAAAGRRPLRRAAGGLAGGRSRPGHWCTRRFLPARPVPRNRPGRTGLPPGARFPWPPTGAGSVPRRTEPELGGDFADGLRGLAEQDLGGGVGDHRPAQVGAEDVLGVLGDRGQARVVLAAGLGHPEQEPGAFGVAHQQPRLIDGDQPPPSPGGRVGDPPPGRVQGQQRADGLQFLGQVPQAEHDQVPGGAGRGRRGEQARRGCRSV